jgi:alpha-amylase
VLARKLFAYGEQEDYFDDAQNCIGWVRRGTPERRFGLACVMSNADPGTRRMFVGEMHAGETWTDVLGWAEGEVKIDGEGWGEFACPGVSVGVWVNAEAEGRDMFLVDFDSDIYRTG